MEPVASLSGGAPHSLADLLAAYAERLSGDQVRLGDVAAAFGRRSIAVVLLLLALPMAIPVPSLGLSAPFGLAMMLIAAQLAIGRHDAWVPQRPASRSIARADLVALINRVLPTLRRFERIIRPRAAWLAGEWSAIPVGVVCLVLAIVIALPIPFGNILPGNAVCLLALGLIERDGVAVGLGLLTAALALVLVAIASSGLVGALASL